MKSNSKKERVTTIDVAEPKPKLWSNCLRVSDTVYIAGLTSRGADGVTIIGSDEYQQTQEIYRKINAYITAAKGDMNDIVQMTIYVTNMANNKQVWRAREEFFEGDFPTCALVEVSALASSEILVEISATAIIGCSG
jgi:enamine deaminase RidA (YjgF/YER057c/UK114 family)